MPNPRKGEVLTEDIKRDRMFKRANSLKILVDNLVNTDFYGVVEAKFEKGLIVGIKKNQSLDLD